MVMRPPPPPPPWIGSPGPPLAVIDPELSKPPPWAVIQTLPPEPPPERVLVALKPLALMTPLRMTVPPTFNRIDPPPAPPGPPTPAPPPLPRSAGLYIEP